MMRTLLLGLLLTGSVQAAELPSPEVLLNAAIAQHDPEAAWGSGSFRLVVRESRPDGDHRDTHLTIDDTRALFELRSVRDGDELVGRLESESCAWQVNGSAEYSEEVGERHRLTCERLERLRNYYTYLWGLPMKLRDPGTRLGDRVVAKEFEGTPALELRVTYQEDVGKDIWYVYFDPADHSMIGYRFYHDEAANDGEYITLEGVVEGAGLRLPQTRAWYTHGDRRHLGTDTLVTIEKD